MTDADPRPRAAATAGAKPKYGEPWKVEQSGETGMIRDRYGVQVAQVFDVDYAHRAAACLSACAGLADPERDVAALRFELDALKTGSRTNTVLTQADRDNAKRDFLELHRENETLRALAKQATEERQHEAASADSARLEAHTLREQVAELVAALENIRDYPSPTAALLQFIARDALARHAPGREAKA